MFEAVLEEIRKYDTIIIHRHRNADGDASGSQIGLMYLIKDNFPDKTVYVVGDPASRYDSIAGKGMDLIDSSVYNGALAIIVDTPSVPLICDDRFGMAAGTVRIDHHLFSGQIADVEVIQPDYESCAGLITDFAIECGLRISKQAATALFMGTVTDSGRFRYDSTTVGTFRRVAVLMEAGVDMEPVYQALYTTDIGFMKLKARFMLNFSLTEHRVAYYYVTKAELDEMGISAYTAVRAFVNVMADLDGVHIWVAFAENPKSGQVECELRSLDVNVCPVAVKYGGGGHEKACGATVPDKETAMAMLRDLDRMAADIG
jgi:phosphoesterase RecJ-like protein